MTTVDARNDLLRRVTERLRQKRLNEADRALLAEVDAALSRGRGKPRALTAAAAEAAIAEHGSIEEAARQLDVDVRTVRAALRRG